MLAIIITINVRIEIFNLTFFNLAITIKIMFTIIINIHNRVKFITIIKTINKVTQINKIIQVNKITQVNSIFKINF